MLLYSENHTHWIPYFYVYKFSTHMPLARHDLLHSRVRQSKLVSTHMPLARHDTRQSRMFRKNRLFLLTCLLRGMTVAFPSSSMIGAFLLTCLLRGMTYDTGVIVIKHWFLLTCLLRGMTLDKTKREQGTYVSTHMPLARHDFLFFHTFLNLRVSTHMPLARHDPTRYRYRQYTLSFYSHASCEA